MPDSEHPPQPPADPLAPARQGVKLEAASTWAAPSRFGPLGKFMRRVLWRILRPYDVRRREVESSLLSAIDQERDRRQREEVPGALGAGAAIVPEAITGIEVIEVDTPVGSFVLDRGDKLIRPAIEGHHGWGHGVATVLQRSLRPGMRFLDIGANMGYFSVLGSQLVGPSGSVVAVEPDPRNLQLLRANLWRNRCSNVSVLPVAADSRRGHIAVVTFPEGGGATEVTRDPSYYEEDGRVEVEDIGKVMAPSAPLDDLIVPPVHVMKMDTQFTEHEVIEGLRETIAASPDLLIITEFGPTELRRREADPLGLLGRWAELGFEIAVLQGIDEVPMSFEEIVTAPNDVPLGNGPFFDLVMRKVPA